MRRADTYITTSYVSHTWLAHLSLLLKKMLNTLPSCDKECEAFLWIVSLSKFNWKGRKVMFSKLKFCLFWPVEIPVTKNVNINVFSSYPTISASFGTKPCEEPIRAIIQLHVHVTGAALVSTLCWSIICRMFSKSLPFNLSSDLARIMG